ncbi:hypothetical protein J9B83_11655, partial [Marinomonas sp. A79]
MVILDKKSYFTSGGARDIYLHPDEKDRFIKIQRNNSKKQNLNEKFFFERKSESEIIPKYYGYIETNLGYGISVEIVRDENGEISSSLKDLIENKKISKFEAKNLVHIIEKESLNKNFLIHDGGIQNILVKKIKNTLKPVLVDGFGAKTNGPIYYLRSRFSFFAKFKTRKQISIMSVLQNFQRIVLWITYRPLRGCFFTQ